MSSNDALNTAAYLKKRAREEFPEAFSIVSAADMYNFSLRDVKDEYLQVEVVHIGHYTKDPYRSKLWAHPDGNEIRYYRGRDSQHLTKCDTNHSPYPEEGVTLGKVTIYPFELVAPRTWPYNDKAVLAEARRMARKRLELLVKFVFMLNGRSFGFTGDSGADLLKTLRNVCEFVHRTKQELDQVSDNDLELEGPGKIATMAGVSQPEGLVANPQAAFPQAVSSVTPNHNRKRLRLDNDKQELPHDFMSLSIEHFSRGQARMNRSGLHGPYLEKVAELFVQYSEDVKSQEARKRKVRDDYYHELKHRLVVEQEEVRKLKAELAKERQNGVDLQFEQERVSELNIELVRERRERQKWQEAYENLAGKLQEIVPNIKSELSP